MAQLDRFIEVLFKYAGEQLVLRDGHKVSLNVSGAAQPISSNPLLGEQIVALLREVMPADLASKAAEQADFDFVHQSPLGAAKVQVQWSGGAPMLVIAAANGSAAAAGAGSAPPANGEMERLLRAMVESGSSDLHLTSNHPPLFRLDGSLKPLISKDPLAPEELRSLLHSISPQDKWQQYQQDMDVDFSYEIQGVGRYRCNFFVDRHGPGGVFRLIPFKIPTAQELGLSKEILGLCDLHKGLVIVTGPTGSGKSTTLAAMLDHINTTKSTHIITIEDPIEFVYPAKQALINQREVETHTHGFKHALRAALREDPDIILVGEMRDLETIAIAIETAETGHLVFGTLHTNTAPSAVDRMIDQFPADQQNQVRTMLSSTLKGVIAQTLCKKKGGGRVAAQEVLMVNSAVSNLIREGKTFQIASIMQTGKNVGMQTLNDALLQLVKSGTVEMEEAFSKAVSRSEFKAQAVRHGFKI